MTFEEYKQQPAIRAIIDNTLAAMANLEINLRNAWQQEEEYKAKHTWYKSLERQPQENKTARWWFTVCPCGEKLNDSTWLARFARERWIDEHFEHGGSNDSPNR